MPTLTRLPRLALALLLCAPYGAVTALSLSHVFTLDTLPAQIPWLLHQPPPPAVPAPPPPPPAANAEASDVRETQQIRRCGWEIMEDGETSMARLGALYAAQTGDTSQCVEVDGSSSMKKGRNGKRDGGTSGGVNSTTMTTMMTTTRMPVGKEKTTFCACVFETCGNGVWVRDDDDGDDDEGSGEAASGGNTEEAWEYVKACQKYCHAGTCV